jgi:hypothetical protein
LTVLIFPWRRSSSYCSSLLPSTSPFMSDILSRSLFIVYLWLL